MLFPKLREIVAKYPDYFALRMSPYPENRENDAEVISSMLKPGEKKSFHQALQPLVECVQTHHNGNITSFLDFHKDWTELP
jgi:hypothetical protein